MSNWNLALINLRSWWASKLGLVALLSAGVFFSLSAAIVTSVAEHDLDDHVLDSTAMRTITVTGETSDGSVPLTSDYVESLGARSDVEQVYRWVKTGGSWYSPAKERNVAVWAVPYFEASRPDITEATRADLFPLADDEIILPDSLEGDDMSWGIGDELEIEFTERVGPAEGDSLPINLDVVGLYDSSFGGIDGPGAAYVSEDTAMFLRAANDGVTPEQLVNMQGVEKIVVVADGHGDVSGLQTQISNDGFYASSIHAQLTQLPGTLSVIGAVGKTVSILVILLSLFVGLSIGFTLVASRVREIGIWKALGFSDGRVVRLLALELGIFVIIPVAIGVAMAAIAVAIVFAVEVPLLTTPSADITIRALLGTWWVPITIGAPLVAILAGAIFPLWRSLGLPPDTAMRRAQG